METLFGPVVWNLSGNHLVHERDGFGHLGRRVQVGEIKGRRGHHQEVARHHLRRRHKAGRRSVGGGAEVHGRGRWPAEQPVQGASGPQAIVATLLIVVGRQAAGCACPRGRRLGGVRRHGQLLILRRLVRNGAIPEAAFARAVLKQGKVIASVHGLVCDASGMVGFQRAGGDVEQVAETQHVGRVAVGFLPGRAAILPAGRGARPVPHRPSERCATRARCGRSRPVPAETLACRGHRCVTRRRPAS